VRHSRFAGTTSPAKPLTALEIHGDEGSDPTLDYVWAHSDDLLPNHSGPKLAALIYSLEKEFLLGSDPEKQRMHHKVSVAFRHTGCLLNLKPREVQDALGYVLPPDIAAIESELREIGSFILGVPPYDTWDFGTLTKQLILDTWPGIADLIHGWVWPEILRLTGFPEHGPIFRVLLEDLENSQADELVVGRFMEAAIKEKWHQFWSCSECTSKGSERSADRDGTGCCGFCVELEYVEWFFGCVPCLFFIVGKTGYVYEGLRLSHRDRLRGEYLTRVAEFDALNRSEGLETRLTAGVQASFESVMSEFPQGVRGGTRRETLAQGLSSGRACNGWCACSTLRGSSASTDSATAGAENLPSLDPAALRFLLDEGSVVLRDDWEAVEAAEEEERAGRSPSRTATIIVMILTFLGVLFCCVSSLVFAAYSPSQSPASSNRLQQGERFGTGNGVLREAIYAKIVLGKSRGHDPGGSEIAGSDQSEARVSQTSGFGSDADECRVPEGGECTHSRAPSNSRSAGSSGEHNSSSDQASSPTCPNATGSKPGGDAPVGMLDSQCSTRADSRSTPGLSHYSLSRSSGSASGGPDTQRSPVAGGRLLCA